MVFFDLNEWVGCLPFLLIAKLHLSSILLFRIFFQFLLSINPFIPFSFICSFIPPLICFHCFIFFIGFFFLSSSLLFLLPFILPTFFLYPAVSFFFLMFYSLFQSFSVTSSMFPPSFLHFSFRFHLFFSFLPKLFPFLLSTLDLHHSFFSLLFLYQSFLEFCQFRTPISSFHSFIILLFFISTPFLHLLSFISSLSPLVFFFFIHPS